MKVQLVGVHQAGFDYDGNQTSVVVQHREGCQRARHYAEHALHQVGRHETHAPGGADPLMKSLEVQVLVLMRDNQKKPALLVLQQKVLCEGSRHVAAQRLSLFDGLVRRIGHRGGVDAEILKSAKKAFARIVHIFQLSVVRRLLHREDRRPATPGSRRRASAQGRCTSSTRRRLQATGLNRHRGSRRRFTGQCRVPPVACQLGLFMKSHRIANCTARV